MSLQFAEDHSRPKPQQQQQLEMVWSGETDDAFSVHSEDIPVADDAEEDDGRVKHLVNAFQSLLSITDCVNQSAPGRVRRKWAFPAVQRPICYADDDQNFDVNQCSCGGRESGNVEVQHLTSSATELPLGKNGTNNQKNFVKFTSAQPFRLLTEQRGQMKEQEFMKKLKEMLAEEAKQRIPVAQGLPWTTDVPQILPKPPVKGRTKPLDIKLHTQIRAVERAEFDHLVAEKLYFLEQQRLEEERLQKLIEEEEIKRLRKEMIPRAQIMPFFDRPFTPRRSTRRLTIPKEPKFHIPHHRRECVSCNGL